MKSLDKAQQAHDNRLPDDYFSEDGPKCPKCGEYLLRNERDNGYICPQCMAETEDIDPDFEAIIEAKRRD